MFQIKRVSPPSFFANNCFTFSLFFFFQILIKKRMILSENPSGIFAEGKNQNEKKKRSSKKKSQIRSKRIRFTLSKQIKWNVEKNHTFQRLEVVKLQRGTFGPQHYRRDCNIQKGFLFVPSGLIPLRRDSLFFSKYFY